MANVRVINLDDLENGEKIIALLKALIHFSAVTLRSDVLICKKFIYNKTSSIPFKIL